jgi:hypothetical protein
MSEAGIRPCVHAPVGEALCNLVHIVIDPLYEKLSVSKLGLAGADATMSSASNAVNVVAQGAITQVSEWSDFGPILLPVLKHLGVEVRKYHEQPCSYRS